MTKPKPCVPIPADVGDKWIYLRNGTRWKKQNLYLRHWCSDGSNVSSSQMDVIRVGGPFRIAKPKRQDKDAAYMAKRFPRNVPVIVLSEYDFRRINAIAARLQKLADSGETK